MTEKVVEKKESPVTPAPKADSKVATDAPKEAPKHGAGGAKREFKKNPRKQRRGGQGRGERKKPEFEQKLVSIRRVTRVMAGGRRFSFSVGMVAGDKKGRVGFGAGKAGDTTLAIEKAYRQAQKNMFTVNRTESGSIPYEVKAKYTASEIAVWPTPGRGLTAGSAVRDVLQLAGVTDVSAKVFSRTKNPVNTVKATIKALKQLPEVKKADKKPVKKK